MAQYETTKNSVCALITIYHPDIEKLVRNLQSVIQYAGEIVILGNSKIPNELLFDKKIVPIQNKSNRGISWSINVGMKYAAKRHYEYAIFFDQDSFLNENDFRCLFSQLINEGRYQDVICIGPRIRTKSFIEKIPGWLQNKKHTVFTNDVVSVKNIITSGMMVNVKHFMSLNGFDENFPIDFCDLTFCYKALHAGIPVLQSRDVFLYHEVGLGSLQLAGKHLYYHQPYRNYFMARDSLFVSLCFPYTPVILRFRFFCLSPIRLLIFLVLLDNKTQRLKMWFSGIRDFLCQRRGFGSVAHLLEADE